MAKKGAGDRNLGGNRWWKRMLFAATSSGEEIPDNDLEFGAFKVDEGSAVWARYVKEWLTELEGFGPPENLEHLEWSATGPTFRATLNDGRTIVVRVFPGDVYHRFTETLGNYEFCAARGLPTPRLLASDDRVATWRKYSAYFMCEQDVQGYGILDSEYPTVDVATVGRLFALFHMVTRNQWGRLNNLQKGSCASYVKNRVGHDIATASKLFPDWRGQLAKRVHGFLGEYYAGLEDVSFFSASPVECHPSSIRIQEDKTARWIDLRRLFFRVPGPDLARVKARFCQNDSELWSAFIKEYGEAFPPGLDFWKSWQFQCDVEYHVAEGARVARRATELATKGLDIKRQQEKAREHLKKVEDTLRIAAEA